MANTIYDYAWGAFLSSSNVYDYAWKVYCGTDSTSSSNSNANKTEGQSSTKWTDTSGSTNSNTDITTDTSKREIRQLRDTPGYTTYVTDYTKTLEGKVVDSATLKRYYSNIDAEVYVNGTWVEDIGMIQWNTQQQTIPLYGYNSYIFDGVAQGSRIIQGQFTLAFTSPRKLEKLIKNNYQEVTEKATTVQTYEAEISQLSSLKVLLNRNGTTLEYNKPHCPIWMNDKFDIDIVCGEYESVGGNSVHIILKNCWLTGTGSMRNKDGDVAVETYQFFAQDYKTIK